MEELKNKAIEIVKRLINASNMLRDDDRNETADLFYKDAIASCNAYAQLFKDYETFYKLL